MDLSSKSLLSGDWRGTDKLGQLLEQIREALNGSDRSQDLQQRNDSLNNLSSAEIEPRPLTGLGFSLDTDYTQMKADSKAEGVTSGVSAPISGRTESVSLSTNDHSPQSTALMAKVTTSSQPFPTSNSSRIGSGGFGNEYGTPSHQYGLDLSNATFQLAGASDMITDRGQRRSQRLATSSPSPTQVRSQPSLSTDSRSSRYKSRKARGAVPPTD